MIKIQPIVSHRESLFIMVLRELTSLTRSRQLGKDWLEFPSLLSSATPIQVN